MMDYLTTTPKRNDMKTQLLYPDASTRPIHLGPTIGQGSYSTVRQVIECPALAVKIYRQLLVAFDQRRRQYLESKLTAMLAIPPPSTDIDAVILWPTAVAYTSDGKLEGYAMRRLPQCFSHLRSHPLTPWHPATPDALRLARQALTQLHSQGFVMGDVSPTNILTDPVGKRIALADCDSWQFRADDHAGRLYIADSYTSPYLAPELRQNLAAVRPNCVNPECPQAGSIHQQKAYQCAPRRPQHDLAALDIMERRSRSDTGGPIL